jgi:hypothetical protein
VQGTTQPNVNMAVEGSEKRAHARSQFFLLHEEGGVASVYAFRPEDAVDAIPALVVDLGEGGLQVLTANTEVPAARPYRLELALGNRLGTGKMYDMHRVWSRADGVNTRSGFAFEHGTDEVQDIGTLWAQREHKVLRCVLYPK